MTPHPDAVCRTARKVLAGRDISDTAWHMMILGADHQRIPHLKLTSRETAIRLLRGIEGFGKSDTHAAEGLAGHLTDLGLDEDTAIERALEVFPKAEREPVEVTLAAYAEATARRGL